MRQHVMRKEYESGRITWSVRHSQINTMDMNQSRELIYRSRQWRPLLIACRGISRILLALDEIAFRWVMWQYTTALSSLTRITTQLGGFAYDDLAYAVKTNIVAVPVVLSFRNIHIRFIKYVYWIFRSSRFKLLITKRLIHHEFSVILIIIRSDYSYVTPHLLRD